MKRITACLLVGMLILGSFIGFLSLIPTNVNAAGPTYVSGPITSNTVWSLVNSPYIVQGDVLVTNGTLLTINAGVTVKFDGLYSLIVNGTLDATGTSGQTILFTSNQTFPAKGDWDRIRLQGKNNKMDYCKIQFGNYPLYIMGNDTNNVISHCKIENNSGDGVYLKETSNNTLSDLIVSYSNSNGITLLMTEHNLIKNCFSHNNKAFGIYLRTATNNTIINSNSSNNNGGGFELSLKSHYNTLKNVKVFSNQDNGVDFCGNGYNTILDSKIIGNNVNGINMGGKAEHIWIENCIINNNGEAGIDLKSSTYSDIVSCDITYNFGEAGVYTGGKVSYINITDSYICSNYNDGVEIYSGRYVNITDSEISNNMWNGIYFNGSDVQEHNLIDSCMISGNVKNGIYLYTYSYSTSNIQNNKISYNTIYSNLQNGILLHAHGYYYTSASYIYAIIQYNTINNNNVYSNNVNGIYIEAHHDYYYYYTYVDYNDISNNTVYLNTQNGIYLEASSKGYSWIDYNNLNNNIVYLNGYNGILLEGSADQYYIYITYNNIHNNKIYSNTQNGINIYANTYSSSSSIYYNNIFNNIIYSNAQNGIYFSTNLYSIQYYFMYNNVYSNTIYLNSHNGIYFYAQGSGYSQFHYNCIYNNTVHSNSKKGIYIYCHNNYYHSIIQYNDIYSNTIHSNSDTGLYIYLSSECTSYASPYYYSYFQNNNIYLNTIYSNDQNGITLYGQCKNGFLYFQNNEIFLNNIYWHNNSCGIYARTDNSTVSWQSSNIYKNTLDSNLIGLKFLRIRSHMVYINNITNNKNDGVFLEDSYSNTFGYNKIAFNFGNGIHLINNSKTNKIQNNNITQNYQTGIYVNGNSDSNTITRNDIHSNYVMGINISYSMNNMMHHNNLKNNAQNAHDTTTQLNSWDDGTEGNWWDDYLGFDANNDGIGDIPYDVPGGGSKDWYPIIKPANITAPHVESTIPTNGQINISVTPKISVTFSNKMNRSATESAISMAFGAFGVTLWNFTWSNGDLTVTFEPLITLSSTTKYTVTISIAAKDVLSSHLEQKHQFSFTTKDVVPPYITLTSPFDGAVDVALNTMINVTFSEPMNCSTVTFTCSPDPGGWSVTWSNSNSFASFAHNDFGSSTTYIFKITVAKDMSGNDLISWWAPNPWSFTTVDVEGPEIVTTSPANGSTGILLNANVVVTFSEQMNTTSVTYTCSPDPGGWNGSWSNSDKTVTYSHNIFNDETTYTFHITAGKDKKDNALNPSVPNPWNFRTQDATPPKIIAVSPLNGSKNVLLNANIIVTFNEAMDTNSVTHTCNPNPGGWTVTWSGSDTVATYIHSMFNENTEYTFYITGGKDVTGNSLIAGNVPNPWTFTALDTSAPDITATMPVNGVIDITLNENIIVTFSEPMDTSTVAFTCSPNPGGWSVTWSAGNTIAIITHDLFTSFTNYTFHITAGEDETGNDLVKGSIPNPWWFKTKDALSPAIISVSPENGTKNVVLTANVVVTFSERMETSTVNYICSPNPTGWAVIWSAEDKVATYTHEPFERFTRYTFHISSGKDLSENNLVAGEVLNPWTFTTADNLPPTILTAPIEIATEDVQYIYDIEAFDLNDDILTYQLTSYPPGMTINSSTGEILWTPTNDQVGENPVTLIVSDGRGGADTQNYIITVENVNDDPVITSVPVTTGIEDTKYNYELEAYDIDADDSLTYSLTIFPTGMDIDSSTGLITWVPTNEQVGSNQVSVKVVDKNNGFAKQLFEITVSNVNDPPEITSTPVTSVKEDGIYVYDVEAIDIDPTEDELTFRLTTYPTGMELDASTGLITWRPINDQVGVNNFAIEVTDGNSGIDTQSFVIDVENVNDPPTIISTPVTSAIEDDQYIYDVEAVDIDIGDMLTFHLTSNPPGMVIDSDSGMITWRPTNDNVGSNPVTVEVVDGGYKRDSQTFTILVVNVNDRPAFTSTPVTNATIDVEYFYDVDATDIDPTEDELTFTLTTYPTGMNIDPTTGVITWTPTPEQEGENNVVVVVADGNGGTNEQAFTITVEPLEPTGDEGTTKETNDELVFFNILLILIIIILIFLLFMFVLKPPKLLKGKVKPEEPSEDKAKLPSEPTSGLSPLIAQPPPVPEPKPKIKPEPQPQIPTAKPKPELPPVPKIKPKPSSPIPKIKAKPEGTLVPKIKTRLPKPP